MAEQLIFDWPTGVALEAEDFFVSAANAEAYALIADPLRWPQGKLALSGPSGCGKSHLARVFAAGSGAMIVQADALPADLRPRGAVVVEDVQNLPHASEEALFHLHNHQLAHNQPLLLTAQCQPARWAIALPDLASRMQATTPVQIAAPDDALLQAVLMKLFADRQIMPAPEVVRYLVPRIERSFAAAQRIVLELDAVALAEHCRVSRKLAARILDKSQPLL